MFVTSHVLAGATIGALTRNPAAAFVGGFLSHLGMDNLPHWGLPPGEDWLPYARKDGLLGLLAMASCAAIAPPSIRSSVVAGMLGGAFPDLDKPGRHFAGHSPFPERFDRFHALIQREAKNRLPHEIVAGAGLAALAVALLRRSRSG